MADILAYAETRGGALRPVAGEVVATARKLADQMDGQVVAVVVGGPGSANVASGLVVAVPAAVAVAVAVAVGAESASLSLSS